MENLDIPMKNICEYIRMETTLNNTNINPLFRSVFEYICKCKLFSLIGLLGICHFLKPRNQNGR